MIPVRSRLSALVAMFLLATTTVPALSAENPLAKGQWAFEFAAQAFSANAASFLVRRHFSDRSALQLDAYVTARGTDRTMNDVSSDPADTANDAGSEKLRDHSIQLGASYVFYPKAEGKALLFLSGGGFYLRGKSTDHLSRTATGVSTNRLAVSDFESKTWGAGATGKIGFDWFFSPRLSLGSRYGVTLGYTHRDIDVADRLVDGANVSNASRHAVEKSLNFDMTELQIGISFYP